METYLPVAFGGNDTSGPINVATARNAHGGPHGRLDFESETFIAHALRADGFDGSEDGTGRGTPLVPIAFNWQGGGTQTTLGFDSAAGVAGSLHVGQHPAIAFTCKDHGADADTATAPTLRAMVHDGSHANAGGQVAVAFDMRGRECGSQFEGPHDTANVRAASGGSSRSYIAERWAVRRLTPLECERLQAFPDGYTLIPYRGKPAADGPRYKALGNAMACNVMRWLGRRIDLVREEATALSALAPPRSADGQIVAPTNPHGY